MYFFTVNKTSYLNKEVNLTSVRFLVISFATATYWNSAFLTFTFIIEGASKMVLQFFMSMEPIYNKNLHFNK
jgi:hypothetical protein